jgi:hypothetical protein
MADLIFDGAIKHSNLPTARGLTLGVAFFRVPTADTPPPFNGDPPGDAVTDCYSVYESVDLHADSIDIPDLIPFSIAREPGIYYLQLRAVLYRFHNGKHFAQVEQFFFTRRPLEISAELPLVTLPMEWPDIPLEDLGVDGTVKPKRKLPWPLTWVLR